MSRLNPAQRKARRRSVQLALIAGASAPDREAYGFRAGDELVWQEGIRCFRGMLRSYLGAGRASVVCAGREMVVPLHKLSRPSVVYEAHARTGHQHSKVKRPETVRTKRRADNRERRSVRRATTEVERRDHSTVRAELAKVGTNRMADY